MGLADQSEIRTVSAVATGLLGPLPCVGESVEVDRPQAGGYTIYEPALAVDDRFQRKVPIEMIGSQPVAIEER